MRQANDIHRVVPRRRVAAIVHLTDGSALDGDLYAASGEAPTPGEPILDRLNDPDERYLPLACEDRHVLLNKSGIRYVELARVENPLDLDPSSRARTFRVVVALDSGESIGGLLESPVREAHYRTLDRLNDPPRGFLRILRGDGVAYVNHDHVVSVRDLPGGR